MLRTVTDIDNMADFVCVIEVSGEKTPHSPHVIALAEKLYVVTVLANNSHVVSNWFHV